MTERDSLPVPVNSLAYWESRFAMDWDAMGGREQSRVFMDLLVKYLPAAIYEEVATERLSILDCGCAKGDGTQVLAREFPQSQVAGFDFSATAIEEAQESHSGVGFFVADFASFERQADVLVASNCFEHLRRPMAALERLTRFARRYVLLLVPYLETYPVDPEHVRVVHAKTFPEEVGGKRLTYRILVPPSPVWTQHQLLLVYEPADAPARLALEPLPSAAELVRQDQLLAVEGSLAALGKALEVQPADELREQRARLEELTARLARETELQQGAAAKCQELARQLATKESELAAIHDSRLWRLAHVYWSLLRRLRAPAAAEPPPALPAATPGPEPALHRPAVAPGSAYDVICFPIIDWEFRFQRPQQLMLQFARHGHRVFYVCQNFRQEGALYGIRPLVENVYEVSLRGPACNVYQDILNDDAREQLLAALDALRRDLALGATVSVVQLPFWRPLVEAAWRRFAWPIVYDCMDDHSGFSTNRPAMVEEEKELLRTAQLVVVSSQKLLDGCRAGTDNLLLLPNACDYEHFARVGPPPRGARPVIGYYGAIADWFDSDLVADLAQRRPGWDFVLVGSTFTADLSRLAHLPNVELPGEQPYASLPGWLDRFDALILPFKRLPLTEATSPVKAYEILASGRPLVSVPLPEMTTLPPLVRLASTAEEFASELEAALGEDDRAPIVERRAFARENTWERRHAVLAPRIREAFPKASIVIVTIDNLEINRLCLESLYQRTEWPNFEVIVVDNASTDGTVKYLAEAQKRFLSLHVLLNDRNLGFAAANNLGLRKATGAYIVILNNDTVLVRGWLTTLLRHLHARPEIGLIGPVSNAVGNEAQVEVGYTDVENMPGWAASYVQEHDGEVFSIPMLGMFCAAMRREAFERIGELDERFGIGMFEDDDYARRARLLGYEIACARDSFVHHWQRASFRLLGEREYLRIFEENRRKYEDKWQESWVATGPLENQRKQLRAVLRRIQDSRGAVIFLPSIEWDVHLVQRPHHLARAFAAMGYVVVFDCNGSMGPSEGFEEVEPNLFMFHGNQLFLRWMPDPILWAFSWNFHLVGEYAPEARTVYDWVDDLALPPERKLFDNHRRALAQATVVASASKRLHEQAFAIRPDAFYLPDGVDYDFFAAADFPMPDEPKLAPAIVQGRPIAGYCGDLARWLDYELLEAVARRRPDWCFLLIGPMQDESLRGRDLLRLSNVVWTGPRDYSSLRSYLQLFDVALIPFRADDPMAAVSSLRLYECFACGKPVVATPIPECRAVPEVFLARDAEELACTLDAARDAGRDPKYRTRLREVARQNSWKVRAGTALAHLGLAAADAEHHGTRVEEDEAGLAGARRRGLRGAGSRARSTFSAEIEELPDLHRP